MAEHSINKEVLRLSRLEILIMISIAMSGVTMYYIGSLVEPIKDLQQEEIRAGTIRTDQLDLLLNLTETSRSEHETIAENQLHTLVQHDNITKKLMNTILLNTAILNRVNQTTTETNQTMAETNQTLGE